MITLVRTANIHDGKMEAALVWAVKITKYLRDKIGGNIQLMRNVSGPIYQVHWVSTHESLAELEKRVTQFEADEGYKTLVAEARQQGLFIGTSMMDALYQSIA